MKTKVALFTCTLAFALASCKKDRACVCTTTYTNAGGNVTTMVNQKTTYTDIRKRDAKSLCQKSTIVDIDNNGGTTTTVNDCKLQ